jgi:hypothetical protein
MRASLLLVRTPAAALAADLAREIFALKTIPDGLSGLAFAPSV